MESVWSNAKTSLFILENGARRPLWWTGIKEITWDTDYCFACPRCGSVVGREQKHLPGTCPHCGFTAANVVVENMGNALVTFEGMLPKGLDLIGISRQTTIELLHSECAIAYELYDEEDVLLQFSDCTIVSQSMANPIIIGREGCHFESLTIFVKVKCHAEWLKGREQHG